MACVLTRNQMEVLLCAEGSLPHLTPLGAEALHAVRHGL